MLDDLLVDAAGLAPFGRDRATHAMMGRFGNLLLVNGEPDYRLTVDRGEVVRFFLTNVSNTRTFKRVVRRSTRSSWWRPISGSSSGRRGSDSVVIAPAERYVVEVRFDAPGEVPFANRVQAIDHVYGNYFADDAIARLHHGHGHAGRAGPRGRLSASCAATRTSRPTSSPTAPSSTGRSTTGCC